MEHTEDGGWDKGLSAQALPCRKGKGSTCLEAGRGTWGLPPQAQEDGRQKTHQKQREQRPRTISVFALLRQAGAGRLGEWQVALATPRTALPRAERSWDSWVLLP